MSLNLLSLFGGTLTTISNPQLGYEVIINLGFKVSKSTDNKVKTFDFGTEYDYIQTDFKMILTEVETNNLISFLEDQEKSRTSTFLLIPLSSYGFFPFGPDLGDRNAFDVKQISTEWSTRLRRPFNKAEISMKLHMVNNPTYVIQFHSCKLGKFELDNITTLPNPQISMNVENHYKISTTLGGQLTGVDIKKSQYAYDSNLTFNVDKYNACLLLTKLKALRTDAFIIKSPANCYPFGFENGIGEFQVRLSDNKIKVVHNGKNNFKIDFKVSLENVL